MAMFSQSQYFEKVIHTPINVNRQEAVERMRQAKWKEKTISLLLKHADIKTAIPIGPLMMTIVE